MSAFWQGFICGILAWGVAIWLIERGYALYHRIYGRKLMIRHLAELEANLERMSGISPVTCGKVGDKTATELAIARTADWIRENTPKEIA